MAVGAVIVAAGRGTRLGAALKKAYVPLGGRPLLLWSLAVFARRYPPERIVLVVHPEEGERTAALLAAEGYAGLKIAFGGPRRQDSVLAGARALSEAVEFVLVHDAARPFVSPELIARVEAALGPGRAVVPVVPVKETIKRLHPADGALRPVAETPPRSALAAAQTPQGFDRRALIAALEAAAAEGREVTDEATLFEGGGRSAVAVPGEEINLKVTTPLDLILAETILRQGGRS
ncbi:MAG: 2-C-methyl-D-erythritol 4-phosphate cytidylyltransferase [Hydrogenibacillus schlegelii]|nr:2-C-methyl-D-erythritol 4-phosphate cytidylyltransferase [Hydrogenibacillus schlegelii]